jgi:hypothetical protein
MVCRCYNRRVLITHMAQPIETRDISQFPLEQWELGQYTMQSLIGKAERLGVKFTSGALEPLQKVTTRTDGLSVVRTVTKLPKELFGEGKLTIDDMKTKAPGLGLGTCPPELILHKAIKVITNREEYRRFYWDVFLLMDPIPDNIGTQRILHVGKWGDDIVIGGFYNGTDEIHNYDFSKSWEFMFSVRQ